ncbi:hypothetical protein [Taibaiella koreensis]|uniref:hypothetical protein n=1 Tax=Taibaiella koreensis TaxID=1268548 RepID=UPI000E59EC3B|nr:hypothetical protein [Taibaiella koreensis]
MKHLFSRSFLLLIVLTATAFSQAAAQWFGLPGVLQRYEIGYSYSVATATYKRTEVANNGLDTSFSQNVTSKNGFGGMIGTAVPLKRLSDRCMLALGIGYTYNMYTWDYNTPSFSGVITDDNGNVVYDFRNSIYFSGVSMQMGLPLSADFKFGNDAFLNKNVRWGATMGIGVMPSAAMTADFDNAGFGFGAAPFAKAELSFFAGICFKLRAQYAYGYIPFYDGKNNLVGNWSGYNVKSSLIGKQQITFSLILMPFSWAWNERGWWNSY